MEAWKIIFYAWRESKFMLCQEWGDRMWFLLLPIGFAANPWDNHDASIRVEKLVSASPMEIFEAVDDLKELSEVFPATCLQDWALSGQTAGVGARGRVTYRFEKLKRRLTVTISKAETGRYVELDHLGPKGFITRWLMVEEEEGTKLSLETFMNPPPWPFKGYYFKVIQPKWHACYELTLDNLIEGLEPDKP